MNTVDKVINVAMAEIGYIEKANAKQLDSKTANAGKNNFTKYGAWFGMNGVYWCCEYISWIFCQAYGKEEGKKLLCGAYSASCETVRQNFIKAKKYFTSNPRKGDIIFFKGSRHAGANHIAIIKKVYNNKIYTVEGNTSNGNTVIDNGGEVCEKCYSLSYEKILGYGRPSYDTDTTQQNVSKTVYFPKCESKYTTISEALTSLNIDNSKAHRKNIAIANNIANYTGTADQNTNMLNLLKRGKLIKP